MKTEANTPEVYISSLPENRKPAMEKLRNLIRENLPEGFEEIMAYGMIAYVVPHSRYPAGYHAKPETPLPFINLASQKNHIAIYHMGLYANDNLLEWFTKEYDSRSSSKLDMGKSCICYKNPENIPYELLGELFAKMTPEQWIEFYENSRRS